MSRAETAEIFISYARSSEPYAEQAANALREAGYQVWWDDDLPAHRAYSEVIEERLAAARAVLVIWSSDAAKSQWVRAEADTARQAGKLVQLRIDGAPVPIPFNQIQCPTLEAWNGDRSAPAWAKVERSVAELVGAEPEPAHEATMPKSKPSICVLPFANTSGDPDQEYFSDGITEDLITDLSQIGGLSVVARNTSFTFKGKPSEIPAVARQLAVSHILEGSVRKSGKRLRITAQLIDGATGRHLWAERFDREMVDVFDIQDEISAAIIAALKLKLLPVAADGSAQPSPDVAAYQDFLKGRHCWNRGTEEALQQAVALFEQAIDRDPGYARAYAGLADAFVQMGSHTYLDPPKAYGQARAAAERALELDPDLADAHASLGLIAFVHDWDVAAAERHLRRAVELDPASATARYHYSRVLTSRGQNEEAIAQAQAAVDLDPLSVAAVVQLAGAHTMAGQTMESIAQLKKARTIFPGQFRVHYSLAFALGAAGRGDEAVAAAEQAVGIAGRTVFALGVLGYAKACAGAADDARSIAAEMEQARSERYVCPFDIAAIYAALDEPNLAIGWLEEGLRVRDHAMLFAKVDPAIENLRADPRFKTLVAKIGEQ